MGAATRLFSKSEDFPYLTDMIKTRAGPDAGYQRRKISLFPLLSTLYLWTQHSEGKQWKGAVSVLCPAYGHEVEHQMSMLTLMKLPSWVLDSAILLERQSLLLQRVCEGKTLIHSLIYPIYICWTTTMEQAWCVFGIFNLSHRGTHVSGSSAERKYCRCHLYSLTFI